MSPKAKKFWSIEDGVLKSHGLLAEWGADLATEKKYKDFVLMVDFRMPTISDSGINFRRLIPERYGAVQSEIKGWNGTSGKLLFSTERDRKENGTQGTRETSCQAY